MLKEGYDQSFASGTICAVGTLGILIPPSIMLVLMADRMAMSVGDLFLGAVFPGLILASLYIIYIILFGLLKSEKAPAALQEQFSRADLYDLCRSILPPLFLIIAVLGSIFFGVATPTEAAGVGACGALLLTFINKKF